MTRSTTVRALFGSGLLILLTLAVTSWLVAAQQRDTYREELTRDLFTAARMLRAAWREGRALENDRALAALAGVLRREGTNVVVTDPAGRVLVDTTGDAALVQSLPEQTEVRQALRIGWGEQARRLTFAGERSQIVAVRLTDEQGGGVVWLAKPLRMAPIAWRPGGKLFAALLGIALVATLTLALALTYLRSRLVRRLTETARHLSAGDLSARADVAGSDEYAALSAALNQMRRRMAAQVDTIDRQRRTLESLVNQLREGVIVTRPDGCIALINPAAVDLLSLAPSGDRGYKDLIGLPLERCLPQHTVQRLLRGEPPPQEWTGEAARDQAAMAAPDSDASSEAHLQIETPAGLVHLLLRATDIVLPEETGRTSQATPGRMLVISDITALTRAMRIKADFAANASHELRTPLSTIRAAIEALLEMDMQKDAATARRFLEAVNRHSARLEALVSDLLDLSRLEAPGARFEPEVLETWQVLESLHARFAEALAAKSLHWELRTAGAPERVVAHPHLLRLVLDNLVDNAIKFTDAGGHVQVACATGADAVCFEVIDDGCGVPEEEQERVFERFYQVERARSGHERGTGLGLSIVRHAIEAMRGTVVLASAVGKGTKVTVKIPQMRPA